MDLEWVFGEEKINFKLTCAFIRRKITVHNFYFFLKYSSQKKFAIKKKYYFHVSLEYLNQQLTYCL